MELILWRHAEAEESVPDVARKLTDKGLKQATDMAEWLKYRLPENTRIIVSPAKRTQQTATALSGNYETNKEIGPGATASAVLAAADWPNANGAVVVVGHQPTLGEVAANLIPNAPAGLSFRKGAVWWFSYKQEQGGTEPELYTVIYPNML